MAPAEAKASAVDSGVTLLRVLGETIGVVLLLSVGIEEEMFAEFSLRLVIGDEGIVLGSGGVVVGGVLGEGGGGGGVVAEGDEGGDV